jgi:hypothetical protein
MSYRRGVVRHCSYKKCRSERMKSPEVGTVVQRVTERRKQFKLEIIHRDAVVNVR